MNEDVRQFVKEALIARHDRETIRETLTRAGWPPEEISTALDAYADTDFPIPVPKRKPYLSAREAFLYLVMFLTLYISAFSFGTLLFQFINKWLPDPTLYTSYSYESIHNAIRQGIASLIITFPIFVFVSSLLGRIMLSDPDKRTSKVRKWLTYITLFIAAGVIIGDLITLVSTFLGEGLTMRFVLKVLSVLLITSTIFGYYLWDLRLDEREEKKALSEQKQKSRTILLSVVAIAVLASLITGISVIGSPSERRSVQIDAERVMHLERIASAMDQYWAINNSLPPTLETLRTSRNIYLEPEALRDPSTMEPYAYRVLTTSTYELCATFETASTADQPVQTRPVPYGTYGFWSHGVGITCFNPQLLTNTPTKPPLY